MNRDKSAIDSVILDYVSGPSTTTMREILELGEPALVRVVRRWVGKARGPRDPAGVSREDAEHRWHQIRVALANAYPDAFFDLMASRPRDWSFQTTLAAVLGAVDDSRSVDVLCEMLSHKNYLVRTNAVRALSGKSGPAPTTSLVRAVRDEEDFLSADAIEALIERGPETARAAFEGELARNGISQPIRRRLEGALSRLVN